MIETGALDPSFVVTHRLALEDAAEAYRMYDRREDGVIKVLLSPFSDSRSVAHIPVAPRQGEAAQQRIPPSRTEFSASLDSGCRTEGEPRGARAGRSR